MADECNFVPGPRLWDFEGYQEITLDREDGTFSDSPEAFGLMILKWVREKGVPIVIVPKKEEHGNP